MANISIRKLDDKVYERLRVRAAQHGVSMEEEVRQIVSQAVLVPERISDIFKQYFGHNMGIDLEAFFQDKKPHDPMDFDE